MSLAALLTIVTGAAVTALLSLSGIVIGVPLGLLLALVRWVRLSFLNAFVTVFVSLVRSTPIVTLVLFVFFVLPTLGLEVDPVPAAVATLAVNTSAFNCEIWRGALMDFPRRPCLRHDARHDLLAHRLSPGVAAQPAGPGQ